MIQHNAMGNTQIHRSTNLSLIIIIHAPQTIQYSITIADVRKINELHHWYIILLVTTGAPPVTVDDSTV